MNVSYFLDDVFLLHFPLETPQGVLFNRLTLMKKHFWPFVMPCGERSQITGELTFSP
jgi:hypothetical protein